MTDWENQTKKLNTAISESIARFGAKNCERFSENIKILGHWYNFLDQSELTGCCDEFLNAFRVSLVEACASLAAGLVRPGLFSMRTQVDAIFIWLYFKDHPVEWQRVETYGEGYMLKRDVFDYLETNYHHFKKSFDILKAAKTRVETEPYKILSAHIHFQSVYTVPDLKSLDAIVSSNEKIKEVINLQGEVSEYINDVLLALLGSKWASLPDEIMQPVKARLRPDKLAILCGM